MKNLLIDVSIALLEILKFSLSMVLGFGKVLMTLVVIYCLAAISRVIVTYGLGPQPGLIAAQFTIFGGIIFAILRPLLKSDIIGAVQDFLYSKRS